jgi:hypothetical protein
MVQNLRIKKDASPQLTELRLDANPNTWSIQIVSPGSSAAVVPPPQEDDPQ